MAYIEDDTEIESSIHGILLSRRYGGILVGYKFKHSHLNKKALIKSYNDDGIVFIVDKEPPAEIKSLIANGYRVVIHSNETATHYYSNDGR